VYGTQVALPFTDRPFGVGSTIIDPAYTLPLVGASCGLLRATPRAARWNAAGARAEHRISRMEWRAAARGVIAEALRLQGSTRSACW
jgi:inner membrane protein